MLYKQTHNMASFDNNTPIKPTDLDTSLHIPYAKIKSHANGGKYIWAKTKVKAPPMRLAFDYNQNEDDKTGRMKYDISLSFMGSDTNPKIAGLREMCEKIDQYNIDWATANSQELWNEDLTSKRVIVEDRYNPMVKMPKKAEYSPTLKVKLMTNFNTGKNEFQVFSNVKGEDGGYPEVDIWDEENGLDLSMFKAKTEVASLIEYTGLWVVGKKFYPGWKLVQVQPKSSSAQEKKYALDDSDEEDEEAVRDVSQMLEEGEAPAGGAFDEEDE